MAGQLSNRNHIGRLLELQRLVVRECRLCVYDEIGIHWTILLLAFDFGCIAHSRKTSVRAAAQASETTGRVDDLWCTACTTLQVELRRPCRQNRSRNNDAGNTDKLAHGIRGEVAELLEVQSRLDHDLYVLDGLRGGVIARPLPIGGEREEDCSSCSSRRNFKLRAQSVADRKSVV